MDVKNIKRPSLADWLIWANETGASEETQQAAQAVVTAWMRSIGINMKEQTDDNV